MKRFAPQIEKAVLEAHVLWIIGLAEDWQGQFLGSRQHLDITGVNLHLAGRQGGIDGIIRARLDLTIHANDPFATDCLGNFEGRGIRIRDNLGHAIVVTHVYEQQPSMVAYTVNPAREPDIGANIGFSEGGAVMAAIAMHRSFLIVFWV